MEMSTNDSIMYITKAQIEKIMNENNIEDYDIYDSTVYKGGESPKKITFVVELLDGTRYDNSAVVDIKISAISDVNTAKAVLDQYGRKYTLQAPLVLVEDTFVQQSYETPVLEDGFEELDNTFSATVTMNGTFVIGYDILTINSITIDGEEIDVFNFQYEFTADPQPVPLASKNGRTITKIKAASLSISFTLDSESTNFLNKVLAIAIGSESLNNSFEVSFSLGDQSLEINTEMKLISDKFLQNKGQIPNHVITLAR